MGIQIDDIDLPNTLVFANEFSRSGITLNAELSLTGKLIAEESVQQSGQPIELRGGPNYAWVDRPLMAALRANADEGGEHDLNFHGQHITVLWDADRGAIEAEQRRPWGHTNDTIGYRSLVLRFLEVIPA